MIALHRATVSTPYDGSTYGPGREATAVDVTIDESWSPYVQATVTLPLTSPALPLWLLDPSSSPRVRLELIAEHGDPDPVADVSAAWAGRTLAAVGAELAGDTLGDLSAAYARPYDPAAGYAPPVRRSFDLLVRTRDTDVGAGTVTLSLASDEVLLDDYGLVSDIAITPPTLTVRGAVDLVFGYVGILTKLPAGAGASAVVSADAAAWQPGQTAWAYLSPLLEQSGLRLWCDPDRVWHLDEHGAESGAPLVTLGGAGTVTGLRDTFDRDGAWYDAVLVTYTWSDPATGDRFEQRDSAADHGFSRTLHVQHSTPYPGPGAAAALLRRTKTRGRRLTMDAVSDYTLTTGGRVRSSDLGTTALIASVRWSLPSASMTVTTRDVPPPLLSL